METDLTKGVVKYAAREGGAILYPPYPITVADIVSTPMITLPERGRVWWEPGMFDAVHSIYDEDGQRFDALNHGDKLREILHRSPRS